MSNELCATGGAGTYLPLLARVVAGVQVAAIDREDRGRHLLRTARAGKELHLLPDFELSGFAHADLQGETGPG